MRLLNIVKKFTKKIEKLVIGEQLKPNYYLLSPLEEKNKEEDVKVIYGTKLDASLNKLKAIYTNTKKFRIKKKLDKRILKLENISLIRVREM